VAARPFGVGQYPESLLEFFNWGAFSQPVLWGLVYGIWPLVLAALAADVVPYILMYLFFKNSPESMRLLSYELIAQQMLMSIARIYAGTKANRLLWARESMLVATLRDGQARWNLERYFKGQSQWARYGVLVMVGVTVLSAYANYALYATSDPAAALYFAAFPILWLAATVLAGVWISRQAPVRMNSNALTGTTSFFTDMPAQVTEYDGPTFVLENSTKIPAVGFGTYKISAGEDTRQAVLAALQAGYRHIDTASFYGNEESVGQALRDSDLLRDNVYVTSKLWQDQQGYAHTIFACEETLLKLGINYIDLYLIHWPVEAKLESTWKAMEHLLLAGKVRAIGVCNFEIEHLEQLSKIASIAPMVNQIELHPQFSREKLVAYCKSNNILVEAWAPLMRGGVFDIPELQSIGRSYAKNAGQVALRWAHQKGIVVLPKSTHPERIAENIDIFDFVLNDEDMGIIDGLDSDNRIGPDPNTYSWNWPKSSRN